MKLSNGNSSVKLSNNFSLEEFTRSTKATLKGIDNSPTDTHLGKLTKLCEALLQPLRDTLAKRMRVTSGYRSEALNKAVRGSENSQHCKGEAVDFVVDGMTSTEICEFIINTGLDFDQMIDEGGWVHLSYKAQGNRKEYLKANFNSEGKASYVLISKPKSQSKPQSKSKAKSGGRNAASTEETPAE